jgi:hypothetical protein
MKLSGVGVAAVVIIVVGVLLLILGSSTVVQVIGIALICIGLLGFLGGQPASQRLAGYARPAMKDNISSVNPVQVADPEPERVDLNPEAPDSVWEHERELYREKAEHEHPGGEQPSSPAAGEQPS